jgi:hypothetical protein
MMGVDPVHFRAVLPENPTIGQDWLQGHSCRRFNEFWKHGYPSKLTLWRAG